MNTEFTGGGSLDGAVLDVPPGVGGVVTIDRSGQSWYAIDATGPHHVFRYIGYGREGEIMGRLARIFSEAARQQQEAIDQASKPKGCARCGLTFATPAAYQVGHEGGQCLGPGARGQLVDVSGIWALRGTDAARR